MTSSAVALSARSIQRIVALPLTRPRKLPGNHKAPQRFTYYQFQLNRPKDVPEPSKEPRSKSKWLPEEGVLQWAQNKAETTWVGFGKAPTGTWKLKLFQFGERIVDRLEFEELSLKTVDPALGPKLLRKTLDEAAVPEKPLQVPLLYAPSIQTGKETMDDLRALLAVRTPDHKKFFLAWLIAAPFTAPFAIIPVLPNIPFFFCAWRSWSHYRAYRASEYLSLLIDNGMLVPEESKTLDNIYRDFNPSSEAAQKSDAKPSSPQEDSMLITRAAIPEVVSAFGLKIEVTADMYRAVEQARTRTTPSKQ